MLHFSFFSLPKTAKMANEASFGTGLAVAPRLAVPTPCAGLKLFLMPVRALLVAGLLLSAGSAFGQGGVTPSSSATPARKQVPASSAQEPMHNAMGNATDSHGWSLHFQQTVIKQWHPEFSAPYEDSLSLRSREKAKLSLTTTLFIGRRLWKNGAIFFNPEISGGSGLSGASGMAGALNGETFRVGSQEPVLYLARLFVQQRFALGSETENDEDDLNQLDGQKRPEMTLIASPYLSFEPIALTTRA